MGKYDNSVQLFYLGALYCYGLPGMFEIRFFKAEADQIILMLGWVQATNRVNSNAVGPHTVINDYLAEARAYATAR